MRTVEQPVRPLSRVQDLLARGGGERTAPSGHEPDAWLRLNADRSGRWSATLFGPALDRAAGDALTAPLGEGARLLAVAAAKARRALVVHTTDEHGRYVDVLDPPTVHFHQVPTSVVDAAANADAIWAGLSPAVWSPDQVIWSRSAFSGRPRRRRLAAAGKAVAVGVAAAAVAVAAGLALTVLDRASSGEKPHPSTPKTYESWSPVLEQPTPASTRANDAQEGDGEHG